MNTPLSVTLFGTMQGNPWGSFSMEKYGNELHAFLQKQGLHSSLIMPVEPSFLKFLPSTYRFRLGRFYYYPRLARSFSSNVFHIVDHSYGQIAKHLDKQKTVITCHDLIPLDFETDSFALKNFRESISYLKDVRSVVAVSEFTKKALVEKLQLPEEKIRVVYDGVSDVFQPLSQETVMAFKSKYPFPSLPLFLQIGGTSKSKNIERLLEALAILKERKHEFALVKVGIPFTYEQQQLITNKNLSSHIIDLGKISDADLPLLYNSIDALVTPSLVEGFGFPTLEALACGKHVIVSKNSSMEEIAAVAGIYHDPTNVESIADSLQRFLTMGDEEKNNKRNIGLDRAKKFSWDSVTQDLIKLYQEIALDS